jgi:choice-of-anchor A domain-containing protein
LSDLISGGYTIDANGADTILINVSGVSSVFGLNALEGVSSVAEKVIWNFYEATSITVNSAIIGSILAPLAHLSGFGGSTEGSVIAKTIALSDGELHSRPFTGTLPTETILPSTVPLPFGLPLLLTGLGALAFLRGRRIA